MDDQRIMLSINKIRAINQAEISLNGITVIAGENGCGKSTVSKLLYHIIKTSLEFDSIIDKKVQSEYRTINRIIDQLSKELSFILNKEDYIKYRNLFRKLFHEREQFNLFGENQTQIAIDYLINIFSELPKVNKDENITHRIVRIKKILEDSFGLERDNQNTDIISLLFKLRDRVNINIERYSNLKEIRPLSILTESLENVFYDKPIPNNFDLFEYGLSILDKKSRRLLPIHSVCNIAYIDTPMMLGIETYANRPHWDDLNSYLVRKDVGIVKHKIETFFEKNILNGEIKLSDDESYSDMPLVYKRADGVEFDLIECATGLKSFTILQVLYKNGFLRKNSLLIIDEPEAHLHPQWVVEYARLLVMLHKQIGVNFLIASHHPDMISAIRYISEKENITSGLNFYLAEKVKNKFVYNYKNLGLEIEEIFTSFNIALNKIDLYGKSI